MQNGFDKLDIAILSMLYNKDRFSTMSSCQIKDFLTDKEFLAKSKSTTSYNTMVRRVRKLLEQGYISFGYREGNAHTYYLNQKGVDCLEHELLENDMLEEENIDIEGGN